jgi:membrane protein YdbS with pleckstrin-like domain
MGYFFYGGANKEGTRKVELMNTFNFVSFWVIIIGLFYLLFYGGDRPWIVLARVAGMVILCIIIIYFMLGNQPRMWG